MNKVSRTSKKQVKLDSILRNLYRWGFKKLKDRDLPPNVLAYSHPNFKKNTSIELQTFTKKGDVVPTATVASTPNNNSAAVNGQSALARALSARAQAGYGENWNNEGAADKMSLMQQQQQMQHQNYQQHQQHQFMISQQHGYGGHHPGAVMMGGPSPQQQQQMMMQQQEMFHRQQQHHHQHQQNHQQQQQQQQQQSMLLEAAAAEHAAATQYAAMGGNNGESAGNMQYPPLPGGPHYAPP